MSKSENSQNQNEMIPLEFYLSRNYPNPFKGKTIIKYCVGYKAGIEIAIYNSNGGIVKTLVAEEKEAGTYEIEFDAEGLPEGIYYCRLKAENYFNEKALEIKK